MGLEIKSVLKNKVSAVIFFILLVLNMVQVPNYMGHEYDVEQNMNIFETQIQQYQRALSDINLQYMAVKHMGAEEKVYWNSYQDYLSWAIDNAKAGWNLFNKYGKEVFKNKGLIKRYNEITLWDKLYHLDALKKNGDQKFMCQVHNLGFEEADISFDQSRIFMIGSQISQNKKEDYRTVELSVQEQLHQLETNTEQYVGKGPWYFLAHQLRIDSSFAYLFMPLCLIYCVVVLMYEKKTGVFELEQLNDVHFFVHIQVKLFIAFLLLMIASIGIPFLLLGISNGFAGWDTWLLADIKHFFSFRRMYHTDNYVINNMSEYYATEQGFIPDLSFIPLWKALIISLPLIILKLELYIQMAMFCVYTFTKTGFNYLSGIICIILYVISQRMDLISFINPFSITPSLSVLSGCGMQNWLNSICICVVFIFVLLFINFVSVRQKDKMSL